MSIQAALNEVKRAAGRQFDANLLTLSSTSFSVSFGSTTTSMRFWPKGLIELEYIRARTRMEALIANGG